MNHIEELLHNQIKKKQYRLFKNNLIRSRGQDVAIAESHQGSKNN